MAAKNISYAEDARQAMSWAAFTGCDTGLRVTTLLVHGGGDRLNGPALG